MTIKIAYATGADIKVHAADCADLKKAATKRAAYNGVHVQAFADGTTERDVWIDFNEDFLNEGGADAAWPLEFMPCCARTGLVPDADRTWGEPARLTDEDAVLAEIGRAVEAGDKAARNAALVAGRQKGLTLRALATAAKMSGPGVHNAIAKAA